MGIRVGETREKVAGIVNGKSFQREVTDVRFFDHGGLRGREGPSKGGEWNFLSSVRTKVLSGVAPGFDEGWARAALG